MITNASQPKAYEIITMSFYTNLSIIYNYFVTFMLSQIKTEFFSNQIALDKIKHLLSDNDNNITKYLSLNKNLISKK